MHEVRSQRNASCSTGIEGASYPWGNEPADETRCNYLHVHGVPVASYAPNGCGLFDMVGDCQEWTADKYMAHAYELTAPRITDPRGPTEADGWRPFDECDHAIRGGFVGIPFARYLMRCAHRFVNSLAGFASLPISIDTSVSSIGATCARTSHVPTSGADATMTRAYV